MSEDERSMRNLVMTYAGRPMAERVDVSVGDPGEEANALRASFSRLVHAVGSVHGVDEMTERTALRELVDALPTCDFGTGTPTKCQAPAMWFDPTDGHNEHACDDHMTGALREERLSYSRALMAALLVLERGGDAP